MVFEGFVALGALVTRPCITVGSISGAVCPFSGCKGGIWTSKSLPVPMGHSSCLLVSFKSLPYRSLGVSHIASPI
uniref:Uncharacterized protein n=1 Tax=Anguilla anguilla TaxID=7936 RepID=A0A0E9RLI5_ANGAN